MSGTNAEVVRALVEAFAQRDFDAAAPLLHPELEIRPGLVGGLERRVYVGPEGMRQFWADIDTTWAEFRITPEEFREIDDTVLVLGVAFARARQSGMELESHSAWLAGMRDGLIVSFRSFSNPADALQAAGLD